MIVSTRIFHPNWQTICLVVKNNRILLALKKRGFGKGKWNGTGGKPALGETPLETAIRETEEEIRIIPRNLCHAANLCFRLDGIPEIYVYVFMTDAFTGTPAETEEMSPRWFSIADIPYQKMWGDDRYWLPKVLQKKFVIADFKFNRSDKVIAKKIRLSDLR